MIDVKTNLLYHPKYFATIVATLQPGFLWLYTMSTLKYVEIS